MINESDEFFLIFRKILVPGKQIRMNMHSEENEPVKRAYLLLQKMRKEAKDKILGMTRSIKVLKDPPKE